MRLLDLEMPPATPGLSFEFVKGSVTEEADVWRLVAGDHGDELVPADVVVHLAGAGMSGRGMLDAGLCKRVNVGGAQTVVSCASRLAQRTSAQVRLIHMSTYNVVFHGQPVDGGDEDAPYSPPSAHTDFYGASKAEAERLVLAADGEAGGKLRTVALRPGAIFGETETRHLPRIVRLIKLGFFRVAIGSAEAQQDWLYVENLVSAILIAASALTNAARAAAPGGAAYFINDDEPVNTIAFFAPLARALGCSDRPLLRLPLGLATGSAWACEQAWHWLGVPPFMTRAEVFKSAVQHTYSCRRAREQLGYAPLLSSSAGMERVAQLYAGKREEERRAARARAVTIALNAVSLLTCLVLCGAAVVSSDIPLPKSKRIIQWGYQD